jgi:hypothetical protein
MLCEMLNGNIRTQLYRIDCGSGGNLEGTDEFEREQARFLSQILRARPVAAFDCVARLFQKAADFLHKIFLRSAQLLAVRLMKILIGDAKILVGLSLIRFQVTRGKLRQNLRCWRMRWLVRGRFGDGLVCYWFSRRGCGFRARHSDGRRIGRGSWNRGRRRNSLWRRCGTRVRRDIHRTFHLCCHGLWSSCHRRRSLHFFVRASRRHQRKSAGEHYCHCSKFNGTAGHLSFLFRERLAVVPELSSS